MSSLASFSGRLRRAALAAVRCRGLSCRLSSASSSTSASTSQARDADLLERATTRPMLMGSLPGEAKVVVCGGGAQGAAIAYTLAKRGLADQTVIIDKVRDNGVQSLDNYDIFVAVGCSRASSVLAPPSTPPG